MTSRRCSGSSLAWVLQDSTTDSSHNLRKQAATFQSKRTKLFREIVIANLWTVHRSLPTDRGVLASLHQIVTPGHRDLPTSTESERKGISFTERELRERYGKYDGICDGDSGGPVMLATVMLRCMLPDRQAAVLDAMLGFLVMSHIGNTVKAILKLRTRFLITH